MGAARSDALQAPHKGHVFEDDLTAEHLKPNRPRPSPTSPQPRQVAYVQSCPEGSIASGLTMLRSRLDAGGAPVLPTAPAANGYLHGLRLVRSDAPNLRHSLDKSAAERAVTGVESGEGTARATTGGDPHMCLLLAPLAGADMYVMHNY